MTMTRSNPALRTTMLLLLATGGLACGVVIEDPPPDQSGSGTTAAADSSTGSGVSVTSTTGGLAESSTSTTSEPSTATTTSGSTDETAGVFIITPDGGVCVFEGVPDGFQPRCSYCDIAAQDCPDGEKCMPWANDGGDAWNATRCSPILENPAGLGEPCVAEGSPVSGIDSCDLGLLCFEVDPRTLQGTCVALCNENDETSCGPDEYCVNYDYFAPFVCMPRCDPLDPATCAANETCRQIGDDLLCVPDVALPQGLDCNADDQYCAEGESCQWAEVLASCDDAQCCRPWCDLLAPDPDLPCSAVPGEVCRPFFDTPPVGYEHVGVCGLPL